MRKLVMFFLLLFLFLVSSVCFSQKQGEFPPLIGPAGADCTQALMCSYQRYVEAGCAPPNNNCYVIDDIPTCVSSRTPIQRCSFYLPAPTMFPHPPQAGVQTLVYAALGHDITARAQGARIKDAEVRYRYQYYKIQENTYGCEGIAGCIENWHGCGGWSCSVSLRRMYNCCDLSLPDCSGDCEDPKCIDWTGTNCTLVDIDSDTSGDQFAPELGFITPQNKPYMYVGIIPPFRPATKIQWWIRVTDNADKVHEAGRGGNYDNVDEFPSEPGYVTNAGSCITTELGKTVREGGQIGPYDWNTVMVDPPDNRPTGIRCTDYEYAHAGDNHHPYPDWGNDTDEGLKYDFLARGYSSKDSKGKLVYNWDCNLPGNIPVKYALDCDGKPRPGYCERVRVNRFPCNPKANGEGKITPCNNANATGCHRGGGCHSGRNAGPNWHDLVNNRSMACDFTPCVEEKPCDMSPVPSDCILFCEMAAQMPGGAAALCAITNDDCCKPRVTSCTVPGCLTYCRDAAIRGLPCKGFLPDHPPWEGVHHVGATGPASFYPRTELDYREAKVAFDTSSNVSRMYFQIRTEGIPDQFEQELPNKRLEACDVLKLLHAMLHGETVFLNIWIFRIINPDAGDGWVLYIPAAANLLASIEDILGSAFGDLLIGGCHFTEGEHAPDCKDEVDCVAKCTSECIPRCGVRALITGGTTSSCFITCPIQCGVTCNIHHILSQTAKHILTCHMGDITGLISGLTSSSGGGDCPPGVSPMTLLEAFTNSKTHLVADIMDLLVLLQSDTGGGQDAGSQEARIAKTFVPVGSPELDPENKTLRFSLERTGGSSEAAAWLRTIGPNPSMYYNVHFSTMVIGLKKDPPFLTTFAGNIDTTNYGTIFRKPVRWVPIAMDTTAPQLDASKVDFKVTNVTAPPNASVTLQWKTPVFDNSDPNSPTYAKMIYSDGSVVLNAGTGPATYREIAGHPDHNFTRTYPGRKLDFNPATTVPGAPGGGIMGGFNIYRRYYDPTTKRWSSWRLLNEDSGGNKQYMHVPCGDPDIDGNWTSVAYPGPGDPKIDATYRDVDTRPQRYKREVKDIINKNLVDAGGQVRLWYYVDANGNKKRDHLAGNPPGSAEPWKNDKVATVTLVGDTFTFTDVATGSGDPAYDLLPNYTYAYKIVPVDKPNLFSRWRNGFYDGATCNGIQQNNNCDGGNEFHKIGTFKDPLCPANQNTDPKDDVKFPYPLQNQQMYDPPYNEGFGLVAYAAIPEDPSIPPRPPTRRIESACPSKPLMSGCDINGDGRTNFHDFNVLTVDFGARCDDNPSPPDCSQPSPCVTNCNEKWQNCQKDANGYCRTDLNCDCRVNLRDYGILLSDIGEQR